MSTLSNITDSQLVKQIVKTYIGNLSELAMDTRRHFLYRAYLATGDELLHKTLTETYLPLSEKEAERYVNSFTDDYDALKERKLKLIANSKPHKITEEKRKEYWLKHPDIYIASGLLWPIYYVAKFGGDISPFIAKIDKNKYKAVFKELFENPNFIKYAVVRATNLVYLARDLDIANVEDEFLEIFRKQFTDDIDQMDDIEFTNYVYGLTHIVIGDSSFYDKQVNGEKLKWVADELTYLEDKIFERLSLDVNTETALCMRIFGIGKSHYIEKVMERIKQSYSSEKGYIQREEKDSFKFAEHTNAIALLLFNFDQYMKRL